MLEHVSYLQFIFWNTYGAEVRPEHSNFMTHFYKHFSSSIIPWTFSNINSTSSPITHIVIHKLHNFICVLLNELIFSITCDYLLSNNFINKFFSRDFIFSNDDITTYFKFTLISDYFQQRSDTEKWITARYTPNKMCNIYIARSVLRW